MKPVRLAAVLLLAVSCTVHTTSQYVDWQYEYMPLPDSISYPRSYWEANTQKALEVRRKMNWGIPEREFRHFVLPVRVNNETLDDFRTVYADTLCSRVRGMSLYDAALEINHWCHEQATYQPSDARTSAPMQTVKSGLGRCGEESVLAVAAMRAAGIPARQVYTPRWAHTDDNHAWVEVWVDGKWHFLGACEPEARLDMGWFNAPVSRAMILHTKVFGDYDGPEDVIRRTPCFTEINVTSGYVKAEPNRVCVRDTLGNPVPDAAVQFKIYNYGEFYTVATYRTDQHGCVSLNTGCGDMLVWAYKADAERDGGKGMFGFCASRPQQGKATDLILNHRIGEAFSADIDIVPPPENPIPVEATPEELETNKSRLALEDSIRASHQHANEALKQFREEFAGNPGAEALLGSISDKDLRDVTLEVLTDAMAVSSDSVSFCMCRNTLPEGKDRSGLCGGHGCGNYRRYVLCPRVELETLRPLRAELLSSGLASRLNSVSDISRWVSDSIELVQGRNPQNLRTPAISVWRSRKADRFGRDIFLIALCRTLGHPARIDGVTGKAQYLDNGLWKEFDVDTAIQADRNGVSEAGGSRGRFSLTYDEGPVECPMYYRHFTLSGIEEGSTRLMEYGSDADETAYSVIEGIVDPGYYSLTTGTRLSDGSVLARMVFFNVHPDSATVVPLSLRQTESELTVLGTMNPECPIRLPGSVPASITSTSEVTETTIINAAGRGWFLIALMGSGDEPSSHARSELSSINSDFQAWGRPVLVLDAACNAEAVGMFGDATLPIIAVGDSFGRVVYKSIGYNTSLASDLRNVIARLSPPPSR